MKPPTDDDVEDLLKQACVSSLDGLVEILTYEPIAEVWNQFGFLEDHPTLPPP